MREMKEKKDNKVKKAILTFLLLTLAACISAFNLSSVLKAGNLIPGGFSGITVLAQQIAQKFFNISIPFSAIYIPLNVIPVYIGFRYIGKKFTVCSLYVVVMSSVLTDLLPQYTITYDVVLIAIFGGIIGGSAAVITLLQGASGGGTDFISIYFSEKKGIDTWNYIFVANVIILLTAGILFGFDRALYSIIYQFVITQVLNTVYTRYQKDTLLIITELPNVIYPIIRDMTKHDATRMEAEGCFEGGKKTMLYSVVGRDQVDKLIPRIKEADPNAFVNVIKTEELSGNFKKPSLY